jgi:hypothetical protein
MKRATKAALCTLAGYFMQSTAQAAPISYRFDDWLHLHETQWLADGTSVSLSPEHFFVTFGFSSPVSVAFTYDSTAPLTPIAVQANAPGVIYLENFSATGALTNFVGTVAGHQFAMTPSTTTNMSFIQTELYPGTTVDTRLAGLGEVVSAGPAFSGTLDGKVYTLTQMSLSFFSGSDVHVLPPDLMSIPLGTTPFLQLSLTADDGSSVVSSFYLGQISQVPVPATAWLLGSGLVGLAGLGRARK